MSLLNADILAGDAARQW